MSQFFGCISLDTQINISDVAAQMTNSMSFFRGDAIGIYQTNEVFICNKFLFNTPESFNTTSICQNERFVLAATCRLDNRTEIAEKTKISQAMEVSDHEYLLAAYTFYEEACVKHLVGDFSFVVWDKQKQTLFMAKDHLGVKPLFYTLQNQHLFFATDKNAFLGLDEIPKLYSQAYLTSMLAGNLIPSKYTCYEQIHRQKPGHYVVFGNSVLREIKYWTLQANPSIQYLNEKDYYQAFMKLFREVVACRMRTKYNIGCELSGGLDSSGITCMVADVLTHKNAEKLHTFSFVQSPEGRAYDPSCREEENEQEIILKHINLARKNIHKISHWGFSSVWEYLRSENEVNGGIESIGMGWQKPIYERMKEQNCRVKMSGFMGDELVTEHGGYWYFDLINKPTLKNYKDLFRAFGFFQTIKNIVKYCILQVYDYRYRQFKETSHNNNYLHPLKNRVAKYFQKGIGKPNSFSNLIRTRITERSFTNLRMENENLTALRNNAEVRFPFADIRLLAFMLSVPPILFRPVPQNRIFFRKATEGFIPDAVRLRNDKTVAVLIFGYYRNYSFMEEITAKQFQESDFIYPELINFKKIHQLLKTDRSVILNDASIIAKIWMPFKLHKASLTYH